MLHGRWTQTVKLSFVFKVDWFKEQFTKLPPEFVSPVLSHERCKGKKEKQGKRLNWLVISYIQPVPCILSQVVILQQSWRHLYTEDKKRIPTASHTTAESAVGAHKNEGESMIKPVTTSHDIWQSFREWKLFFFPQTAQDTSSKATRNKQWKPLTQVYVAPCHSPCTKQFWHLSSSLQDSFPNLGITLLI